MLLRPHFADFIISFRAYLMMIVFLNRGHRWNLNLNCRSVGHDLADIFVVWHIREVGDKTKCSKHLQVKSRQLGAAQT